MTELIINDSSPEAIEEIRQSLVNLGFTEFGTNEPVLEGMIYADASDKSFNRCGFQSRSFMVHWTHSKNIDEVRKVFQEFLNDNGLRI